MNEIQRLLDLVPFIYTHQGISIKELCREFSVTKQQLLSDLETLFLCGLPGYTPLELMEISFEDGFVFIRNADELKRPRNLNSAEASLLLIGLKYLRDFAPEHQTRIDSLINRLKAKIQIPIDVASQPHLLSFRRAQEGIARGNRLRFRYTSRYSDEERMRIVSPQEVFAQNGRNYLRAYCHTVSGERVFDLERIHGMEILSEVATPLEDVQNSYSIEISIKNRYRKFTELFGETRFSTFSLIWALRAITSAGGDVVAQAPAELRTLIAVRAQSAVAQYEQLR